MPAFDVTHIIGEQGFGDEEILTPGVEAKDALEAILKISPPQCRSWKANSPNWDEAFLFNPEAPNRSEEYCDYYHAKLAGF